MKADPQCDPSAFARQVRDRLPAGGLFAEHSWRIAPEPFRLSATQGGELDQLGRVLLQFYRAVNLLYRQSVAGKQPAWVAGWLDQGKPRQLIELQRSPVFKNATPKVIRPDLLLTENGFAITELDSVPGGIGLAAWLQQEYHHHPGIKAAGHAAPDKASATGSLLGGVRGMLEGFAALFGEAARVHIVISEEAATYRPEMVWLAHQYGHHRFAVRDTRFTQFQSGDEVYRFFELFDLPQVANAGLLFSLAGDKTIHITPPPKPIFEEKLLFALLWNRHLRDFWVRELGAAFFQILTRMVPYTWVLDPAPLPPHAVIPELGLTDWRQLRHLSQRERQLVLKISGFSALAWGSRGVHIGHDLSQSEWADAVDQGLASFPESPYVLQRFHKAATVETEWFDFDRQQVQPMTGRVRLCPYYFVRGEGDAARAQLGGVLATICPADKKIIHGMSDAILAPVWV